MRSLTSAILFFVLNLIGLGLGPLVVGIISDKLAPALGNESLRWAMSIIIVIGAVSTIFFFISAKKLTVDLQLKSK
jgi:MFS family permease